MKKLLIVSIAFPPKSDPESLQVAKYLKHLVKFFNVEVVTSANPTLFMEVDPDLTKYLNGVGQTYNINIIENRYLNYIIRKVSPVLLQLPDSKFSFHLSNVKVDKPDLIYSRSYPLSSTYLAIKLKLKWPEIPWVLHLSDPWALSYDGDSPATNFSGLARAFNKRKEKRAFELADQISFTSEKTISLYKDYYPQFADKMVLTPNVYDDETVNHQEVKFDGALRIVYTGGFGEKRSPKFYLEAIKAWTSTNGSYADEVQFIFTGPMTRKNQDIFHEYSSLKNIHHKGIVNYSDMLTLQKSAHILVNIDTDIPNANHAVFFPSKLLEYMAARRRILAITNPFSTTASVINKGYGDIVKFNDLDKLIELFEYYYLAYKKKQADYFKLPGNFTDYSAEYNARSLSHKFNQLIENLKK